MVWNAGMRFRKAAQDGQKWVCQLELSPTSKSQAEIQKKAVHVHKIKKEGDRNLRNDQH